MEKGIMPTINVEHAQLPDLVNDVINGQEFLITRSGQPVAKLLPIAEKFNRFPDMTAFRASIPATQIAAGDVISLIRDEEDGKFGKTTVF
jgi:antitoxin (DNA-binding transcriptional repressor) of toxin-antitoxin stability system